MDIKYEGILKDGTVYKIELQHPGDKENLAEVLQTKEAERIITEGLTSIIMAILTVLERSSGQPKDNVVSLADYSAKKSQTV